MRSVDHRDKRKRLSAMQRIQPCCRSKPVLRASGISYARYLVEWRGSRIRTGLAIGGIVDGEPMLSEVGMKCWDQWMDLNPAQTIVFAEFGRGDTGNTERLRSLLIRRLDRMLAEDEKAILMLVAKNSTMYDKIAMLIGVGK